MTTRHELEICVDCVMMIANAEGTDEHAEDIERQWPTKDGWHLTNGSVECEYCGGEVRAKDDTVEDCEGWFSRTPCDGCGSRLYGTREHGVAWRNDKSENV